MRTEIAKANRRVKQLLIAYSADGIGTTFSNCYNPDMNEEERLKEVRRKKLLILIAENENNQHKLADKLGLKAANISQVINGNRPMGEKRARRWEKKAGKSYKWMDEDDDNNKIEQTPSPQIPHKHADLLAAWDRLPADTAGYLLMTIKSMVRPARNAKKTRVTKEQKKKGAGPT